MKINKRKIGLSILILFFSLPFGVYFLKSLNIYDTNLPCIGIGQYTVEDFLEKNIDKQEEYYTYNENYERNDLSLSIMRSGNISNMKGLSDLPYASEIGMLDLSGTCVNQISDLEELNNLEELDLDDTRIDKLDGLENMNNLRSLFFENTKIETIENIESIRTDTSEELKIFFDGSPIKYITEESYDYIMDPENKISVIISDEDGYSITINPVYGDSKEVVEEYLEII